MSRSPVREENKPVYYRILPGGSKKLERAKGIGDGFESALLLSQKNPSLCVGGRR
jgi:hypothetical protein